MKITNEMLLALGKQRLVELAEEAARQGHEGAEDIDVYEDAPGHWQVSVHDSPDHDDEWIEHVYLIEPTDLMPHYTVELRGQ